MTPLRTRNKVKKLFTFWFKDYDFPKPKFEVYTFKKHTVQIILAPLTIIFDDGLLYVPMFRLLHIILHEIGHYKYQFNRTNIEIAITDEFFAERFAFRELYRISPLIFKAAYNEFLYDLNDPDYKNQFPFQAIAGGLVHEWFNRHSNEVGLKRSRKKAR
jgi:hypothetical protein